MANALQIGSSIEHPDLKGRWCVWSQADAAPGAYFVIPADDAARGMNLKYAVMKAKAKPTLSLIRTEKRA